jgi:hypothetical protein
MLREADASLRREIEERRAYLHVPETASVLQWPDGEFAELLQRWPEHAEYYGTDPTQTQVHAYYAADLTARGRFTLRPPPGNGPCWCGSDRKYKKCCGSPAVRRRPRHGTKQALWPRPPPRPTFPREPSKIGGQKAA